MRLKINLLAGLGMLLLWNSCNVLMPNEIGEDFVEIRFNTTEISYPNVDISPDGKTILFDVLGDLYTVPINGGTAKLLIGGDGSWNVKAKYSPDGKEIAFLSDHDGSINLWTAHSDGSQLQNQKSNMPKNWRDIRTFWGSDGYLLEYTNGEWYRLKNGKADKIFLHKPHRYDSVIYRTGLMVPNENNIYFHDGRTLFYLNITTDSIHKISAIPQNPSESIFIQDLTVDPSGKYLVFLTNMTKSHDLKKEYFSLKVMNIREKRLYNVCDSLTRELHTGYGFHEGHIVLGDKGKLLKINMNTGQKSEIPIKVPVRKTIRRPLRPQIERIVDTGSIRSQIIRWPTYNKEKSLLTYSALGKLYITNINTKVTKRLTESKTMEYGPAISPNGQWIGYVECDEFGYGHIMLIASQGGLPKQLTKQKGKYTNLTWSPQGDKLGFYLNNSKYGKYGKIKRVKDFDIWLMWIPAFKNDPSPQKIMKVQPINVDPGRFYPPITFSSDGNRVISSTKVNVMDLKGKDALLFSTNHGGTDIRPLIHVQSPNELVASPDGKRVAIVKNDRIYIANLPEVGKMKSWEELNPYQLTSMMGTYAYWIDNTSLLWANAYKIFTKHIDYPEQKAKLLVDIDVRKPIDVPQGCYALTHARILTMKENEVIEDGTILVKNNRIVRVGKTDKISIPEDTKLFDLTGKTVVPGLIDTHAHYLRGGAGVELWQKQNRDLVGNLAWGVTTIYDPAISNLDVFGYSELVKLGITLGPRVYSSGYPIFGHTNSGSPSYRNIFSLEEANRILKERKKYNPSLIKEYLQSQRVQRQWLRSAAKQNGLGITTHPGASFDVSDMYNALTRVVDGYTGLEHEIFKKPVYNDVISFVAKSKIHYTPTIIAVHTPYMDYQNYDTYKNKILAFNPTISLASAMGIKQRVYRGAGYYDVYDNGITVSTKILTKMIQKGGSVSVGAHGSRIPGICTHWELWSFTLGGMKEYDALRCATLFGAKKLGLDEDLGSIEKGKLADMVILNSNPLEDIHNTANIYYVISNGYIYEGDTMTRIWPSYRELKPWPWKKGR